MMSAQDRQVVAQVMQLVLARQDLVHYYHNGNIESKEMGFSVNFDTKKVTFGGVVYTIGKCATILLRSFATSQQMLQFHTSVADTIINTEVKKLSFVNEQPSVVINDKKNGDDKDGDRQDTSNAINNLHVEWIEDAWRNNLNLADYVGKKVVLTLRNGDIIAGKIKDCCDCIHGVDMYGFFAKQKHHTYKTTFTYDGFAVWHKGSNSKDIVDIQLQKGVVKSFTKPNGEIVKRPPAPPAPPTVTNHSRMRFLNKPEVFCKHENVETKQLPTKSFNLEDYIGKTIKVKLRNGEVRDTKVLRYNHSRSLCIDLIGLSIYTESGNFWSKGKDDMDVIEILEVIN